MSTHQIKFSFLKKCFLKISATILFIVSIVPIVGCANAEISENTGIKVNNRVVSSVSEEVESKTAPVVSADQTDEIVFWTESGTYWHTSQNCSYLSRSKVIMHGTEEDAKYAGKSGVCSRCLKANSQPEVNEEPDIKNVSDDELLDLSEDTVFWTKSGTYWHTSQNCSYLSRSKVIMHGTEEDAKYAGKSGVCSRCLKASSQPEVNEEPDIKNVSDDKLLDLSEDTQTIFFWVKSGKVYHISRDCRYISNSQNVISGNIEEAEKAGKEKLCSACGNHK